MRIDLSIDVERAIAHVVTEEFLRENVNLVRSCITQGHAKGTALHPGMSIDWTLTRDEDLAL
jgi:hypothetical protein